MSTVLIIVAVLIVVFLLLNPKWSRSDGDLIGGIHPYRVMLAAISPRANDSTVYFDEWIDVTELEAYLEKVREPFGANITHCIVAALARGLEEVPQMNRFSSGGRLYQRKERSITFSAKRKRLDKKAALSAVKMSFPEGESFADLCARINGKLGVERSGEKTYQDKEFAFLTVLPRPILGLGVRLLKLLNSYNILPASFIEHDPMFTSIFLANLGSVGMGAGYHHLYEWGNCPLFIMAGKIEERPIVVDGQVVGKRFLHLRFTYDERIEDGFTAGGGIASVKAVLEDPFGRLGGVERD